MKEYSNDGGQTWEGPFSESEIEALTIGGVISQRTIICEYGAREQASVQSVATTKPPRRTLEVQEVRIAPKKQKTVAPVQTKLKVAQPVASTAAAVMAPVLRQFYVARPGGVQEGPISEASLLAAYRSGVYPPNTLVYTESQGCWLPLFQVMGSAPVAAAPQPLAMPQTYHTQVPQASEFTNPFGAFFYCISHMTFEGRSRRSEFWMFFLGIILFNLLLRILSEQAAKFAYGCSSSLEEFSQYCDIILIVAGVLELVVLLALLAATCRRLHDLGLSGWLQLLYFTAIGIPIVWIICAQDGQRGTNCYGASPKYPA